MLCVTKLTEVQVFTIISNDFTALEILVFPRGIEIILFPKWLRLSVVDLFETGKFKFDLSMISKPIKRHNLTNNFLIKFDLFVLFIFLIMIKYIY